MILLYQKIPGHLLGAIWYFICGKIEFMAKVILKKIAIFLFTIYLSATTVFFLSRLAPSDPVEIILGENANPEAKAELRKELGVDKAVIEQYFLFLNSLLKFDLGRSIFSKRKVFQEIAESFPETLKIGLLSFIFSSIFSILMALWASLKQKKIQEKIFGLLTSVMVVLPSFLLGPIILLIFSVKFPLFPIGGDGSSLSYVLPAFVLSVPFTGYSARVLKTAILEEKSKAYFIAALQKGLSYKGGFVKHLLPNALLPFIQISGLHLGGLLTGAIIVEKIFRINGIGSLLVHSVFSRDYPLITALIMLFSIIYLLGNLLADFLSIALDPRTR